MSQVSKGGSTCCSVACCRNYSLKVKKIGSSVIFHRFPRNPQIRKEWIRKCFRKDSFNANTGHICSVHFRSSNYEDEMQGRLMGFRPKKLKTDAIPSLHLHPGSPGGSPKKSKRAERYQSKQNRFIVKTLTAEPEEAASVEVVEPATNPEGETVNEENIAIGEEIIVEALQQKISSLENENEELRKKLANAEDSLKKADCNTEELIKNACKDFLSPNQVKLALKRQSKVRWTQEELSRAFTIRYLSKKCYIYLRSTLHYPLPGLSTLHRWAANINLRGGYLEDVFKIMTTTKKIKGPLWGSTVLSFDEVKVCAAYEFDQQADEVVGPHQYMQVVMARGLFENWKQPVYIGFDQKMTSEILNELVGKLHDAKYDVIAIVSDCGGSNIGLWKELNISIENTAFPHIRTQRNIYVFADVPHMLKLLRNWFIDTGFILPGGKIMNKGPIECLLKDASSEISSCYKLTPSHLNCVGPQRQNVALAAQLFSRTTATALKRYRSGGDPTLSRDVGDFIELTNNWFDVMNSYTRFAKVPTKLPYGVNLLNQNETLQDMMNTVKGMRCVGKNTRQLFQKGIIISTKSFQSLYLELKETLKIEYILTHRLNQDCLENFFSQVRTRGGLHDHPSPLQALYRIRVILLGKNPGLVKGHTNVSCMGDEDEYLLATSLKHANIVNINIPEPEPFLSLGPVGDVSDSGSVMSVSSSSSSTSSGDKADSTPTAEKDGFSYVAGFIAKKHLSDYPYLGSYTKDLQPAPFHSYTLPSWIQSLSFGGFVEPSPKWLAEFELLNKMFEKFHHHTFKEVKNINRETVKYISKKVSKHNIPLPLIKAFVRQRIFIRIKYLNQKGMKQTFKRKVTGSDYKVVKKMKKIVN